VLKGEVGQAVFSADSGKRYSIFDRRRRLAALQFIWLLTITGVMSFVNSVGKYCHSC
jgi:hypothetical protein